MSDNVSREEGVKHIAEIIKDIRFALLTTTNAEGHLHSRPMTTQQTEFDGDVWFIGSKDSGSVADVKQAPQVNVSYADTGKNTYLSVTGKAVLIDDRSKLEELWSDGYKAYFEGGIDDPNIQLIKIESQGAEYWESGRTRNLLQMAVAAVTGKTSNDHGTNETVKL
ncbi:pyridoxamine 5'-phosphate oxidase family protein [Deinococcus sp. UYEF24]